LISFKVSNDCCSSIKSTLKCKVNINMLEREFFFGNFFVENLHEVLGTFGYLNI